MKIETLIKKQEAVLGEKLIKFTESKENVNQLVEMLCDRQAEAIAKGYKLGLDDGIKLAGGKPGLLGLK